MSDDDEKQIFREPSKVPGNAHYEQASRIVKSFTGNKPPPVTEKAREEKNDLYRSFDEVRLDAKKDVFRLAPQVLEDYRNDLQHDTGARRSFSWSIYGLVIGWLVLIAVVIVLTGSKVLELGSGVLIALTVGATLSIVGLLGTVVGYFFAKRDEQIAVFNKLFEIMLDRETQRDLEDATQNDDT